jgi:hypothetical protein
MSLSCFTVFDSERRDIDRSVTELEVLYGALFYPEFANSTFVYFRDPEYINKLNPIARKCKRLFDIPFCLCIYLTKFVVGDDVAFVAETEYERQKVVDLKKRIRASGVPIRENYSSPEAVAQMILRDLTEAIERF